MAAIFEQSPVVKLHPKPGFVIKTKIVDGSGDHVYQTKVFINVCHDAQVPKPEGGFEPSKVFPLIVKNEWEIPIIVSLEKKSSDKKGVPSFVYDCCINDECFSWLTISADLRMIAIEWCIESVEMMHELVLEREYTVPKMLSKGDLSATEITQNDLNNSLSKKLEELRSSETAGLVQELLPEDDDEELPDLMNLSRKKPLIQEIEELSLQNEKNEGPDALNENSPGEKEDDSNKHESFIKEISTKKHAVTSGSTKVNYEFTVRQKSRGNDIIIIFESPQLTEKIKAFFQDGSLIIRNTDSTRKLGPENEVSLPLPKSQIPYKCFLVKSEMSLYVFTHMQDETNTV